MQLYMEKMNTDLDVQLKRYKRGFSLGGDRQKLQKPIKLPKREGEPKEPGDEQHHEEDDLELSPRAKSIHIIMRPDEDQEIRKISDQQKKMMKK